MVLQLISRITVLENPAEHCFYHEKSDEHFKFFNTILTYHHIRFEPDRFNLIKM